MDPHRSYVLRCLPVRAAADGELVWRFSIQAAEPEARRRAFNTLDEVVAFLSTDLRIGQSKDGMPAGRGDREP